MIVIIKLDCNTNLLCFVFPCPMRKYVFLHLLLLQCNQRGLIKVAKEVETRQCKQAKKLMRINKIPATAFPFINLICPHLIVHSKQWPLWDPKTVDVIDMWLLFRRYLCFKSSQSDQKRWSLLTGGRYSELVVNSCLTIRGRNLAKTRMLAIKYP